MIRRFALAAILIAASATAAPPVEWDGLQRVASKRFDLVYLQPGADFSGYSKVMLDPTEVSFQKNWRRDYNSTTRDLSGKVSERDVQDAITKGVAAATDIFSDAWTKAGYAIVTAPGPDVLRVRTGVVNISVNAPDVRMAARSRTFSEEAGQATLVVELRDSQTGALVGRVVDQKVAGDNATGWRNSVTNRGDFRQILEQWASDGVRGMAELKSLSSNR